MKKIGILAIMLLIFSSQGNLKAYFENRKLRKAVRSANIEKVQELLKKGANPNQIDKKTGNTLLMVAMRAAKNHLIPAGPNADTYRHDSRLKEERSLKIVHLLLEDGAGDLNHSNKDDYTLLMCAYSVYGELLRNVRYIRNFAKFNKTKISLVKKIIREIVFAGASVDLWRFNRPSPLERAVMFEDVKFVEFFIANGADVNKLNSRGMSPLVHAKKLCGTSFREDYRNKKQKIKIIKLLISAGAEF